MKIKSALLTTGSGSIGGMTLSRNRGGLYFRSRAIPTNPNTGKQAQIRAQFSFFTSNWRDTLTPAQRDDWKTYAENTPVQNVLGDPIILTGLQMYVRCNVARVNGVLPAVTDAPANFGAPEVDNVAFTASAATQALTIVFNDALPWADEDDAGMILGISRPQSPAKVFFNGPFQYYSTILGDAMTPPTSPNARPASQFAFTEGQRLFIRRRVSDGEGRLSDPLITTVIAAA